MTKDQGGFFSLNVICLSPESRHWLRRAGGPITFSYKKHLKKIWATSIFQKTFHNDKKYDEDWPCSEESRHEVDVHPSHDGGHGRPDTFNLDFVRFGVSHFWYSTTNLFTMWNKPWRHRSRTGLATRKSRARIADRTGLRTERVNNHL